MLRKYDLVLPTKNSKSIRGKKKQKERVKLVVCVNATCCHKLPLMLIEKDNRPTCFANYICLLRYAEQKLSGWTFQHVTIGSMRCSILTYVLTYHPVFCLGYAPGRFKVLQRENGCSAFLSSRCNKQTLMQFGSYCSCQKEI